MCRYPPRMSAERAERIRRWHEAAYAEATAETASERTVEYFGRTIVVPPQVMPITRVSSLLGQAVLDHVRPGDRVLDMGTGSGVNAVLAAGSAATVLAVDVNPHAVVAACANAERNGVADRVEVRQSDVFSAVHGEYDLIVFDPPFRWFAPRSALESASTDENYRALATFFAAADSYLAADGRMLVFFGDSGDIGYLYELMGRHGYTFKVLARGESTRDGWRVQYRTHLVRRDAGQRR